MRIVLTAYVRFGNALAWHSHELARGLHAAGHDVLLCCQRGSPLANWTENAPFAVCRDFNLNRVWPLEMLGNLRALRAMLREFQPDVLNPHCPPGHAFLAAARATAAPRVPLVRTVADPRPPAANPLNRRLHRKATDGIVFTSASSQRRYAHLLYASGVPERVILPGFRAADFVRDVTPRNLRAELRLREDQLLIGVIARMSPEKGQEVLLHALALLQPDERRRLHCILTGEDSRERGQADLAALVRELNVQSCVTFIPRLHDIRPLMAALDLGLVTSIRSEAICRVALEYMSCGLPVIASDVNILPEVVQDGETGWIYPNGNAHALAERLRFAAGDPAERRRRGQAGLGRVRAELDTVLHTKRTLDYFEAIITRKREQTH